jgi:hypothetical protein
MADRLPEIPGAAFLPGIRVADRERDRYVEHLAQCHAQGRLPEPAFRARLDAATRAATQGELTRLLTDLPGLPAPRRRVRDIWAAAAPGTGRRWAHILTAVAAVLWAVVVPLTLYTATGHPVVYGTGEWAWEATQHSGLAVAAMWSFLLTGIAGLAVDVGWWAEWEKRRSSARR